MPSFSCHMNDELQLDHASNCTLHVTFDIPSSTKSVPTSIPPAPSGSATDSISMVESYSTRNHKNNSHRTRRQASNICLSSQTEIETNADMNIRVSLSILLHQFHLVSIFKTQDWAGVREPCSAIIVHFSEATNIIGPCSSQTLTSM